MRPRDALVILDGRRQPLSVTLLGQALCVSAEGRADALHPIPKIDRVAVLGDVALSSAALRALAEADRPLAVLDGRCRVQAVVRAMHRPRTGLVEALDRLALRRDWFDRLGDWRRARMAVHARRHGFDPPLADKTFGMTAIARLTFPRDPQLPVSPLGRLCREHARLAALAVLARAGVPDRWTGGGGDSARNLVPTFADIAVWILYGFVKRPGAAAAAARAIEDDARAGRAPAGPALFRLAAAVEAPLRAALGLELARFYPWLLDTVAPGTIPEEDFPWHG